jgi:multiple sugar transport system substrate-binding protein
MATKVASRQRAAGFTRRSFLKITGAGTVAAGVAGFGGRTAWAQGRPELAVMVLKDQPGQDVPTAQLINAWAAQRNIDVKITTVTFSSLDTTTATSLQGHAGPDLVILSNYGAYLYADALMDVSDLAAKVGAANGGWYPISERLGVVNGRWRSLLTYMYMHMFFYRQDVFETAKVAVPATWDQFRGTLQKIKSADTGVAPFGIAYGRSFDGQQFLLGVLWGLGGDVLSADGKRVTLNSPAGVEALKYVVGLYQDGLTAPGLLAWNDSSNNQAWLAGQIATTFNGYSIKVQSKQFPKLYPVTRVAVYPGGPAGRFSFPTAFGYGIRKSTANPVLAKDLLGYMLRKDNYEKVLTYTGGAIGTSFKGFANLPIWREPGTDGMANIASVAVGRILPPSRATAQIDQDQILIDMVADVLANHMTPERAIARAEQRIGAILAQDKAG